jgi:hypothetical protein
VPTSRMLIPPVTQDLWPVLVARIATPTLATILGGAGRVFLEGDYQGQPWAEAEPGGRAVIVPVIPVSTRWEAGLPSRVRFLVRTDFNNYVAAGYNASRSAELAQRTIARRLTGWDPGEVLVSSQMMVGRRIWMDEGWQPRVLHDPDTTGTVFMSSSWLLEVASAAD